MTCVGWPRWVGDFSPRGNERFGDPKGNGALTVAVVNNMPDRALQATERQFCALLSAASAGGAFHLKFYSLPAVKRSDIVQAHIDSFYEDIETLDDDPPDGLIMTGANPTAGSLDDEAFWPQMADVINLCHDKDVPGIWSCLAAHAAVLEIDGIQRRHLTRKLSGIFDCRITNGKHQLFHRMPTRWPVPHSRYHGLQRADLERKGYDIVSGSSEVGVDMFIKRYSCIQVFLQGHPEYNVKSLAEEFRRDTVHALRNPGQSLPVPPSGLYPRADAKLSRELRAAFERRNEEEVYACLDGMLGRVAPRKTWADNAQTLFENWLAYVETRKHRVHAILETHAPGPSWDSV